MLCNCTKEECGTHGSCYLTRHFHADVPMHFVTRRNPGTPSYTISAQQAEFALGRGRSSCSPATLSDGGGLAAQEAGETASSSGGARSASSGSGMSTVGVSLLPGFGRVPRGSGGRAVGSAMKGMTDGSSSWRWMT